MKLAPINPRRPEPLRPAAGRAAFPRRGGIIVAALLGVLPAVRAAELSEPAPLAAQALLLDVARAGDRLVAVGDHGDIVLSADSGRTWIQRIVPTRSLLTGVSFPDADHGWAVGHDGVILATHDGGFTWTRQDDGKNSDTVYLSVLFLDPHRGFVVGAYGRFLSTADGGKTWTAGHPTEDEVHYNRISAAPDGDLYLAGESGTALRSADGGRTWARLTVPYDGSLFGILPLPDGRLLAYGLRGHILQSADRGATWAPLVSGSNALIMGGLRLPDGPVVLGGQGGNFFISRDDGHHFTVWKPAANETSVADLAEAPDGSVIAVGEAGAVRLTLPPP